jgi:hypothetical protein
MDWTAFGSEKMTMVGLCEHGNEPLSSLTFLTQVNNYQLRSEVLMQPSGV